MSVVRKAPTHEKKTMKKKLATDRVHRNGNEDTNRAIASEVHVVNEALLVNV